MSEPRIPRGAMSIASVLAAGLAMTAGGGLLLGAVPGGRYRTATGAASVHPEGHPSPCTISGTLEVAPPTIRECETAAVTVKGNATCIRPLHAMVAVDQDCNMMGMQAEYRRSARNAVTAFKKVGIPVELGVVLGEAWDRAQLMVAPSSDLRDALGAAQGLRLGWCLGGAPLGKGTFNEASMIATSQEALAKARRGTDTKPVEAIVIVGDSQQFTVDWPGGGRAKALAAKSNAEGEDIMLVAACHDCYDVAQCQWGNPEHRNHCMDGEYQKLASSPQLFLYGGDRLAVSEGMYRQAYDEIADRARVAAFAEIVVTDTLAAWLEMVPGSMTPTGSLDAATGTMTWTLPVTNTSAFTLTYRARPKALGAGPVSKGPRGRFTDSLGREGSYAWPSAAITVNERCITPSPEPSPTLEPASTPSPTPPTATDIPTPIPSLTAVPTPTPSVTPTATPRPTPVFLPLALREHCVPGEKRVDVALVIDTSTSMLLSADATHSKLDVAVEAAREFLDLLRLDAGDQAAIVAFNDTAALLAPLTSNRAVLTNALGAPATAQHTCIVCALDVAATELAGDRRRAGNTPVLILLTDGKSNPRPVTEAVSRAAQARQAGVVIFTIGLGTDLDDAALTTIASWPAYYYHAPTAAQLRDIYRQIAVAIPCPAERFWGRR
jgi:uncharacterized protein YegL